jgi:hypothetical protein
MAHYLLIGDGFSRTGVVRFSEERSATITGNSLWWTECLKISLDVLKISICRNAAFWFD